MQGREVSVLQSWFLFAVSFYSLPLCPDRISSAWSEWRKGNSLQCCPGNVWIPVAELSSGEGWSWNPVSRSSLQESEDRNENPGTIYWRAISQNNLGVRQNLAWNTFLSTIDGWTLCPWVVTQISMLDIHQWVWWWHVMSTGRMDAGRLASLITYPSFPTFSACLQSHVTCVKAAVLSFQ